MDNAVTTLAPTFLIGSSSFFQVIRTIIKAWMSLKFCRIQQGTYELAALERLEKSLWTYNEKMVLPLSGWVVTWFLLGYTVRMFEYTVRTF